MKKAFITIILVVAATALFAMPAMARHGNCDGTGPGPHGKNMDKHMDRMVEDLDLNEQQLELLDGMREAHVAHIDAVRSQMDQASRGDRKQMRGEMRVMRQAFHTAINSDSPDFAAAAAEAKANYTGPSPETFAAFADAHVAYFGSLTAEQLDKLQQLHKERGRFRR